MRVVIEIPDSRLANLDTRDDPAFLFEQRVPLAGKLAIIRTFEAPLRDQKHRFTTGHTTLYPVLRYDGQTLWTRGSTSVGIPAHQSIDGSAARESVLSLFALKPGDTDNDFFADYTPEQLAFVERFGEELSLIAIDRHGEP